MHPEDVRSRLAGAFFLPAGAGMIWWVWHAALHDGHYSLKVAWLGPTIAALGLGLLIHGRGIPTSGISLLTRLYGMLGGVATIVSLYLLGYFTTVGSTRLSLVRMIVPVGVILVWLLPASVFGPSVAANPPVEPR